MYTHTHTLTGGKEIYILNHHFFRWLGLKLHIVQLQLCDFADLRHHLSPHGLCNASFLVIETGNQFCPLPSLPFCSGLLFPLYFSFGLFLLPCVTCLLLGKLTPLLSTGLAERFPLLSFGLSHALIRIFVVFYLAFLSVL